MENNKYDDIINLPHPKSSRHAPMSMIDRGAQFSPFAALVGYDDAIRETARLTESRVELDESTKTALDEKIRWIMESMAQKPRVSVTWFRPDERKNGGAYVETAGSVKKVDVYRRCLCMEEGEEISFESIVGIESDLLTHLEVRQTE